MAKYVFDFGEMDGYQNAVETQLGDEINTLQQEISRLESEKASCRANLYYYDARGMRRKDSSVQARISSIETQIAELKSRISNLKSVIAEAKSLIRSVKNTMNSIDEDYKRQLDAITQEMEDYIRRMQDYMDDLDDSILAMDGQILYTPVADLMKIVGRTSGLKDKAIEELPV